MMPDLLSLTLLALRTQRVAVHYRKQLTGMATELVRGIGNTSDR